MRAEAERGTATAGPDHMRGTRPDASRHGRVKLARSFRPRVMHAHTRLVDDRGSGAVAAGSRTVETRRAMRSEGCIHTRCTTAGSGTLTTISVPGSATRS